jgi:hypothetical protein
MPAAPRLLDWSKTGSAGYPAPCVICRRPAICRAPNGDACHKTCAEARIAAHPTDLLSDTLGSAA